MRMNADVSDNHDGSNPKSGKIRRVASFTGTYLDKLPCPDSDLTLDIRRTQKSPSIA